MEKDQKLKEYKVPSWYANSRKLPKNKFMGIIIGETDLASRVKIKCGLKFYEMWIPKSLLKEVILEKSQTTFSIMEE